jgi:hypothetical protein
MIVFLFRPSLRRLISRIRSAYPEPIVFDDTDRQVVTATFEACRSITLISKYMTRTVSYLHLWQVVWLMSSTLVWQSGYGRLGSKPSPEPFPWQHWLSGAERTWTQTSFPPHIKNCAMLVN